MRSRIRRWRQRVRETGTVRRPEIEPLAPHDDDHTVRLLTLNVAHGRKLAPHQAFLSAASVRRNLDEISTIIGSTEADVVGLQEADGPSAWSGNFDHVEYLARRGTQRHHVRGEHNPFGIGNATLDAGTAVLSSHPLGEHESVRFDAAWRDTKGFVRATIAFPQWEGTTMDVVSVHLEPLMPQIRRRQIDLLVEALRSRPRPLVVMGDFNCSWQAKQFRPLVEHLELRPYQPLRRAPTYPALRPFRRLDWILVSPELEFAGYRTLPNPVSDHLGVVADVRLSEVPEANVPKEIGLAV